jgi:hypothetical protein
MAFIVPSLKWCSDQIQARSERLRSANICAWFSFPKPVKPTATQLRRAQRRKAGTLKRALCRKKKRQATRKKKALNKSQRNQKISLAAAALSKCCVQRRATTNTKLPADEKGRRENEEEEENFLKKCWSTLDPDTVAHEHRRFFFRDNGHGAANAAGFSWCNGS